MDLSVTEQLAYSTIRIECTYQDGTSGTGTGFFFDFSEKKENLQYPFIITNKHVIKNERGSKAISGRLVFTLMDEAGNANDTGHYAASIPDFDQHWRHHPDPGVDLCAFSIASILRTAQGQGINLFYIPLDASLIHADPASQAEMDAMEDIVMIGYPNGIWDEVNNKPLFRKGITATHPAKDYKGKKEFVIDAACFPGSSGSPVFIINTGSYTQKNSGTFVVGGSRIILLGLLWGGPQLSVAGGIEIVEIPTVQAHVAVSSIPMNLGFVIKAERILEMKPLCAVSTPALAPKH